MSALSQLLLALVALVGAWIALQQMLIARQKLNHDLFDRRFAIYVALNNYLVAVMNQRPDVREFAYELHRVSAPSPFLFGAALVAFIDEALEHGVEATELTASAERTGVADEEKRTTLERARQHRDWIKKAHEGVRARFKGELTLTNVTPIGVSSLLPRSWL